MRVTVTQLNAHDLDASWQRLVDHTTRHESEFVLLPEMPFAAWLAATQDVDPAAWLGAVDAHESWIERLGELGADAVVGTCPIVDNGERYNEAFVWSTSGVTPWRRKTYLPDEPGFWEATWYRRGRVEFLATPTAFGPIGAQICTEMWFFEHARDYAHRGIRLLTTPRATEAATTDKWLAGGKAAAVTAGAFSLSSNHAGSYGPVTMGGLGWIISPDGAVLATTSDDEPFVTVDVDLDLADAAKSTYPRYVDAGPA
jgi:N-carbamoylputrescine amidase